MAMRRPTAVVWRLWQGEGGTGAGLFSLATWLPEQVFRGAVALRNALYDRRLLGAEAPPIPVISVGNLAVGGTGKTPVSAWIAARLREAGARPALVSRGYGADELHLHRRWNPHVSVVADPVRARGVRRAAREGASVAVLDDGFQHRALGRDLDLVLLAAEHPFPPRLLPRGPYREPLAALGRAGGVIVTRKSAPPDRAARRAEAVRAAFPDLPVARLDLAPERWQSLAGGAVEAPSGPLLAVSSVATPGAFGELVRSSAPGAGPVESLVYPDHHPYSAGDVAEIRRIAGDRTVVTTEKDAVKLGTSGRELGDVRVLVLHVVPGRDAGWLVEAIARAAEGGP